VRGLSAGRCPKLKDMDRGNKISNGSNSGGGRSSRIRRSGKGGSMIKEALQESKTSGGNKERSAWKKKKEGLPKCVPLVGSNI